MRMMVEFVKKDILAGLKKNKTAVMITADDILMLFLDSREVYFINGDYGVRAYINLAAKQHGGDDESFYEYVVQSVDCYHILKDPKDPEFKFYHSWFLALLELMNEKTDLDVKLVKSVREALYSANRWLPDIRNMQKYHFYSLLNIVTNRSRIVELMEYPSMYL